MCVGKMLVLESTEGTGSASSPLEGSVGGAADSVSSRDAGLLEPPERPQGAKLTEFTQTPVQ